MRALAHRSFLPILVVGGFVFAGLGCVQPYTGTPETLQMPRKLKPKPKPESADLPYGGLQLPDTCKTDFTGKEQSVPRASRIHRANSLAQDADNAMAGIEDAQGLKRQNMVQDALGILHDALRMNPYSPLATYTMAKAYAEVGKKKCSLAMLDRLNSLGSMPDFATDVGKLKTRAKTDPAFDPFRKEADGVLGGK